MKGSLPKRARAAGFIAILAMTAIVSAPVFAEPAAPTKDPKALEEAKKHWEAGQAFYNDPSGKHNCEDAVKEFGRAYELSGSVKAARARAICEMELEQDGAAIADYDIYLASPPKDASPEALAQDKSDDMRLKAVVAEVTFHTDKPNTRLTAVHVQAQGLPITNHYVVTLEGTAIKMHPGQYTFTAQADGAPDITWQVEIQSSSQSAKYIDFAAAAKAAAEGKGTGPVAPVVPSTDEGTRPIPVVAWVFGGVTIACLVPTVAAGVLGIKAKSTYDKQNGHASVATLQTLRNDVITKSMVSDIFLGITAAAAITTTVLVITRPTVHAKAAVKTGVLVLPTIAGGAASNEPTGAGVVMLGSF